MNIEPSEIFKVLSVETRVKIIELLKAQGPSGAKDIGATIGITTSALIFGTPPCANQERHRLVRSCLAGKEDRNRP